MALTRQHSASTAAPQQPATSAPVSAAARQWPSATNGCGGQTLLPVVTATNLHTATGIDLITAGGPALRQVDLDSGQVSALPDVGLAAGQFVTEFLPAGTTAHPVDYALVRRCDSSVADTVLRIEAGSKPVVVSQRRVISHLYGSGSAVWASVITDQAPVNASYQQQQSLVRLDGTASVPLPPQLRPIAVHGTTLVAVSSRPSTANQPGQLVLYDLTRRTITRTLGAETTVTVSSGSVLWTSQACSAAGTCPLHTYRLATGAQSERGYHLPVEAGVTGGVLSADGTRLAFQLPREFTDPSLRTDLAGTPSDVEVLDLRTGELDGVPNLEVPPATSVGLAFSRDGRWVVIGLDEGDSARLLVWRSGETGPLASSALLPGALFDSPTLAVR